VDNGGSYADRIEHSVNWDALRNAHTFSRGFHSQTWKVNDLTEQVFTNIIIDHEPLPIGTFGAIMGHGGHWLIRLNPRLAGPLRTSTYVHEVAHTFQWRLASGWCDPLAGLSSPDERGAHSIAALLAVPFVAIADCDPYCAPAEAIARYYDVPPTYVHLRNAVSVFLGEKPGDEADASARWNGALMAHQRWMHRAAELLRAIETEHPQV
jgi:hypothetical protein